MVAQWVALVAHSKNVPVSVPDSQLKFPTQSKVMQFFCGYKHKLDPKH